MTAPATGIYYDVPDAEYRGWDAMNYSRLKLLAVSVEVFAWREKHPQQPSRSMAIGTAVDMLISDPAAAVESIVVNPSTATSKAGKEFALENCDKVVLTEAEHKTAIACWQSLVTTTETAAILSAGKPQVCGVWTDAEWNQLCKMRIDRETDAALVDIKTTANIDLPLFARDAERFGYHIQAAFYRDGYLALTGKAKPFTIIAVETQQPHRVKVYPFGDASLLAGRMAYKRGLYNYTLCLKSKVWRDAVEEELEIPAYALRAEGIEPERMDF